MTEHEDRSDCWCNPTVGWPGHPLGLVHRSPAAAPAPQRPDPLAALLHDPTPAATVPAPVTPDLRAAALAADQATCTYWVTPSMRCTRGKVHGGNHESVGAWMALGSLAALSDRDAEPVSRDPLRLPTWQTIATIYHEIGQIDGCEPGCEENHEDDAKVTLNVIRDAISREAAAPDPTEETR